jgi:hypothetical protein
MKSLKLLTAGSLALAFASIASASTVIHFSGSTAFRVATEDAIVHVLTNPVAASVGTNADMTKNNIAVVSGTMTISGTPTTVVFELHWGGSVGGIQMATTPSLQTVPGEVAPYNTATTTWLTGSPTHYVLGAVTIASGGAINGYTPIGPGTANTTIDYDAASGADVANSDVFQASSPFKTPALSSPSSTSSGEIGVINFYLMKGNAESDVDATSPGAYERFTNVSAQQEQQMIGNGPTPLSQFTGDVNDDAIDVVPVGRNADSGTRDDCEAEISQGFKLNQTEDLFEGNGTAGTTPITALTEVGNNGYSSGSKVANDLGCAITSGTTDKFGAPFILCGYVGKSDSITAAGNSALYLTYNGEGLSGATLTPDSDFETGQYTYWSYEHTYLSTAGVSSTQNTAINNMVTSIIGTYVVNSGIPLSDFGNSFLGSTLSRAGDGQPPHY